MLPVRKNNSWLPDIFDDFLDNAWLGRPNNTVPAINVIDSEKEYKIEVAAPGMTKDDFKVRVDEGRLSVSMEKREEKKEEDPKNKGRYLRREFSYSSFQQSMALPDNVDKDKIEAQMEKGVLTISIPKTAPQEKATTERLIEIK